MSSKLDDDLIPAEKRMAWPGRASAVDAAEFAEHLAGLTRSGLPLPSGLRALATELPSRRLRRTLRETADRLDLGQPLDSAVVSLAEGFPPHLRGLVVAGAGSGRMADVLGQYVRYVSLGADLRRRFWMSVAYPVFLLICMFGLYLFVCTWIVQSFDTIFKDFGVDIPAITRTLIAMSRATREHGLSFAGEVGAIALIAWLAFRFLMDATARRKVVTGIPMFGPLLRWSVLAEFCHLVGLLVDAEMPLPEALAVAGHGVNDAELARAGDDLKRSVEQGRTLGESLVLWPRCPAGLVEVLDGAEGRGDLAPALHLAGDMFEARARSQASFASSLFAAMTLILVLWGIGFVVTALYMPIISLIGRLAG